MIISNLAPKLKVIVGHLGERIPSDFWRIDECRCIVPSLFRYNNNLILKETYDPTFESVVDFKLFVCLTMYKILDVRRLTLVSVKAFRLSLYSYFSVTSLLGLLFIKVIYPSNACIPGFPQRDLLQFQ
jgi:hypothetical protein